MKDKKLEKQLKIAWDDITFHMDETAARPKKRNKNERSLLGSIGCTTNTMGTLDDGVWEEIAAVSR